MELWQWLAVGVAALTAVMLITLWHKSKQSIGRRVSIGGSVPGGQSDAERAAEAEWRRARDEADRRAAEERRERDRQICEERIRRVQEIAQSSSILAERLEKAAGFEKGSLQDLSSDRELIERISRTIDPVLLDVLYVAANQRDIQFNLKASTVERRTEYPSNRVEPAMMNDLSQLTGMLPEQYGMDDDQFALGVAQNQLVVMEYREVINNQRRLYVLLDVSNSMAEKMANGFPRHTWSRGIVASLLVQAVEGEAEYFFRAFDGRPHELKHAFTSADAQQLLDFVLTTGLTNGGTHIFGAFHQAVADIRQQVKQVECSDLLVITDAEDPSVDDCAQLKELFGDDVRLHVLIIGGGSASLRQVATTYKEFR